MAMKVWRDDTQYLRPDSATVRSAAILEQPYMSNTEGCSGSPVRPQ